MFKSKIIRKTFPRIRTVRVKGVTHFQVDARQTGTGGRRETFSTQARAEKRAREIKGLQDALGQEGLTVPAALREMAIQCQDKLNPYNKTLIDATDHFLAHLKEQERVAESRTIDELLTEWKAEKTNSVDKLLALETKLEIKKMANKLSKTFGFVKIGLINKEDIKGYLDEQKWSNRTKVNVLNKWGQFFKWALDKGYTTLNPCAKIQMTVEPREIEAYEAAFVLKMFEKCEESYQNVLPYLAICTFAGVRPLECEKLTWDCVRLDLKPPQIKVKRSTRVVKDRTRAVYIEENLRHWLTPYKDAIGPVVQPNHRKLFDDFKVAMGFSLRGKNPEGRKFIDDGLRHTYATFWKAKFHDESKLATRMGNSVETIRNHYDMGQTEQEATAFWEIVPKAVAEARAKEKADKDRQIDAAGIS